MASPIRIGNVPEHFSSPINLFLSRGIGKKHLIDCTSVICKGGTGEMVKMLQSGDLDVAMALTEGLVAAIAKGNSGISIIGTYVDAPLTWAISAGQGSSHESVETLRHGTIGISRFGSGSHIMSYVLADQKGWLKPKGEQEGEVFKFSVLKDFKGLRDGVNGGFADAFMWETFTTKPYHDSKEVKRIGEIVTPWPAFMIAVRNELLEQDPEMIKRLLVGISEACALFIREKETGQSIDHVVKTYHQKEEDVRAWFQTVKYPDDCSHVSREVLRHCVETLIKAQVLTEEVAPEDLVDLRVASLQDQ